LILKTIATTTRTIGVNVLTLVATLERDDVNSQLFLRVVGTVNGEVHEAKHSIGSSDGVDALAGQTPAAIAALIQPDLDALRQRIVGVLTTRLGVMAAGAQLT
jgi:hypothetical protein